MKSSTRFVKFFSWQFSPSCYPPVIYPQFTFFPQNEVRLAFGRAVAQVASRWLPTAAARARVWAACGVCGGQNGTGAGFL
jgi:hypothetical protein